MFRDTLVDGRFAHIGFSVAAVLCVGADAEVGFSAIKPIAVDMIDLHTGGGFNDNPVQRFFAPNAFAVLFADSHGADGVTSLVKRPLVLADATKVGVVNNGDFAPRKRYLFRHR